MFKYQDKQILLNQPFNHPFIQTLSMFIGESLCFILFLTIKHSNPTNYKLSQEKAIEKGLESSNKAYFWLIIPAIADFFTTSLQFVGLFLITGSVYQILRGGVIVITAFFSVIFLKKQLNIQKYIGIGISILGTVLVGFSVYLGSKNDNESDQVIEKFNFN